MSLLKATVTMATDMKFNTLMPIMEFTFGFICGIVTALLIWLILT